MKNQFYLQISKPTENSECNINYTVKKSVKVLKLFQETGITKTIYVTPTTNIHVTVLTHIHFTDFFYRAAVRKEMIRNKLKRKL